MPEIWPSHFTTQRHLASIPRHRAYAAAIDRARFEVLEATAHMPQMESPDLVVKVLGL